GWNPSLFTFNSNGENGVSEAVASPCALVLSRRTVPLTVRVMLAPATGLRSLLRTVMRTERRISSAPATQQSALSTIMKIFNRIEPGEWLDCIRLPGRAIGASLACEQAVSGPASWDKRSIQMTNVDLSQRSWRHSSSPQRKLWVNNKNQIVSPRTRAA